MSAEADHMLRGMDITRFSRGIKRILSNVDYFYLRKFFIINLSDIFNSIFVISQFVLFFFQAKDLWNIKLSKNDILIPITHILKLLF